MARLIALIVFYGELLRDAIIAFKKKKFKETVDESIEHKDQRKIEKALGNDGDPNYTHYDGMHERDIKE